MFMTQIIMLLCEIYQVVKILAPATFLLQGLRI